MRRWVIVGLVSVGVGCGAEREASCAGVACGASEPPVTLHVVDAASSAPVDGVVLANVTVSPAGSRSPTSGCASGPEATTCVVDAGATGTYELDVTAPGYQSVHVTVDVPAYQHVAGACCEPAWAPQTVEVRLPAGG